MPKTKGVFGNAGQTGDLVLCDAKTPKDQRAHDCAGWARRSAASLAVAQTIGAPSKKAPSEAPTPQRDGGPDSLYNSERPRSLQETVNGAERTGSGEAEDVPVTTVLECVANHHRRHGEQAEQGEPVDFHGGMEFRADAIRGKARRPPTPSAWWQRPLYTAWTWLAARLTGPFLSQATATQWPR